MLNILKTKKNTTHTLIVMQEVDRLTSLTCGTLSFLKMSVMRAQLLSR